MYRHALFFRTSAFRIGFRQRVGNGRLNVVYDFDFIDEIYFASPSCVNNFSTMFGSIPERITVTCADQRTEEEYRKMFG